ncbi:MAG: SAM-dependent methyltransferase [Nitrospira sp.]
MQPTEFPQYLHDLAKHHAALDPMHLMYDNVLKSGYLHFGFWPTEQAREVGLLARFAQAQERFADEFLAYLPPGRHQVLDVGAGMGRLAHEMTVRGHTVTAITPSSVQAEHIAKRYPAVTVKQGRLQDIGPSLAAGGYDVLVFSESFRYMPLKQVLPLFERLLSPQGRIIIGDWFAQDSAPPSRGHDHLDAAFRAQAQAQGWTVLSERDITQNILPTLTMAQEILCGLYLPLAGLVLSKFAQKRPRLFRLCLPWMTRALERKLLPQLIGRFEPAVFASHYRYLFLVLGRAAAR